MVLKSWSASVTRAFVFNVDQPRLCLLTRVHKSSSKPSKKAELSKGSFWGLENDSGVVRILLNFFFFQTFHNSPEFIHPIFTYTVESLSTLRIFGKKFWDKFE